MNLNTLALWTCSALAGLIMPAYGQIAVTDSASIVQQATSSAKDLAAAAQRLQSLQQQYQQLQAQYQAVTGVRDLGGAVGALGQLGVANPLPVNPSAVQGLMNGNGGIGGMGSSIGSLFNGNLAANRTYQPTTDTWLGREMTRTSNSNAGAQALSLELYKAASERMTAIEDLRCQIEAATDPATRESLTAQLTAAQAAATAQQVQATALSNYAAAGQANDRARLDQRRQQESDGLIAEARAHGINVAGGLGGGS